MKPEVEEALRQLAASFPGAVLVSQADPAGGAWFFLEGVELGPPYVNPTIWVGADISAQYPYADLYPVFVSNDLTRLDGKALGEATSQNVGFHGRNSVQLSRRSNNRNPSLETAAMKILKVLTWLKSR